MRLLRLSALMLTLSVMFGSLLLRADEIDRKYPLDPQLKVLAEDIKSPKYRQLVLEKMLLTDLAAEWQRVATADNPESFLEKHGGKESVFAASDLKQAYERREQIRKDYLDLMRQGFERYKKPPPFEKGTKAEIAGTVALRPKAQALPLSIVLPCPGAERHWPRFRGPNGQGEVGSVALPTEWNRDGRGIIWRAKVPGAGNSSPVIWGDRIFLTSADPGGIARYVHCFRRSDGSLRWTRQVPGKPPEASVRDKNGFASATPVTDGQRVIAFLGSCGLVCYDFEGKLLWHHDLAIRTTHGSGSSPVIYKDLVILAQDQNQADSVFLALDKNTGKKVWEEKRPKAMTWTTPVVIRVGDHDELILAAGGSIRAYEPTTGKQLWSLNGPTVEVVPTIVAGSELLYSASGRNGPTIAFRPGGTGDATQTHSVWRAIRGGPHVPSPALAKGRLYIGNDTGIISCFDAITGKLIYSERVDDRFSASPVVAGDNLYFPGESGITYVVRAADTFDIIAQNDLGSPILASPAVMEGQIFLRTENELVCIGIPAKSGR